MKRSPRAFAATFAAALASLLCSLAQASSLSLVPTGLLCNFQRSPALGVTAAPQFSWVVPPCAASSGGRQTAFQIIVKDEATNRTVWDSGTVASSNSTGVP